MSLKPCTFKGYLSTQSRPNPLGMLNSKGKQNIQTGSKRISSCSLHTADAEFHTPLSNNQQTKADFNSSRPRKGTANTGLKCKVSPEIGNKKGSTEKARGWRKQLQGYPETKKHKWPVKFQDRHYHTGILKIQFNGVTSNTT